MISRTGGPRRARKRLGVQRAPLFLRRSPHKASGSFRESVCSQCSRGWWSALMVFSTVSWRYRRGGREGLPHRTFLNSREGDLAALPSSWRESTRTSRLRARSSGTDRGLSGDESDKDSLDRHPLLDQRAHRLGDEPPALLGFGKSSNWDT